MPKLHLAVPALFVFAAIPPLFAEERERPAITGKLERLEGYKVLRLWGTPRERGYAHGWLLADEIFVGVDKGFSRYLPGGSKNYSEKVLPLVASAFTFEDHENEELEGLLEGMRARYPQREIPVLGRAPELSDLKVLNTFGDWYALGCSSAAVWGSLTPDGKAAVVRNFDFLKTELSTAGQHVRVVAPRKDALGWVGVAHPGSIGTVTAMNTNGVFVSIHDVNVRPGPLGYFRRNVPRLVALRRLVEQLPAGGAVQKAAELCRSWSTLFGNNFLVATPEPGDGPPAGVLEYDSREEQDGGVTLRIPKKGDEGDASAFIICTNHHRLRSSGTCGRYNALVEGCKGRAEPFDLSALVALVNRAAIPAPGVSQKNSWTPTLHQAIGRTGERKLWVRFLREDDLNIRSSQGIDLDVRSLCRSTAAASKTPPARTARAAALAR